MARNYRNLYTAITAFENLHTAWRKASRGKRQKPAAAGFEMKLEDELVRLQRELITQIYRPGPYRSFYIRDPKRRLISAAPFRDRVVHHAVCNIIEPIFEKTFIRDSYANRKGKGTHAALDRAQYFSRKYSFVLQCDIRQFFPSIDHTILETVLSRKITDQKKTLGLIREIIRSGEGVLDDEYHMVLFPGDDLLSICRQRGLPIGNLTSQIWANVYLNELDQFIKRSLKCSGYLRYVDDFLLFSESKRELWSWKEQIELFLNKLRLTLHPRSSTVYPISQGIPFLGFRVYPAYRRLKRKNGVNFSRKLRRSYRAVAQGKISFSDLSRQVQGWVAHAEHGNTWNLRKSLLASPRLLSKSQTRKK